jgi:hypothetical protein
VPKTETEPIKETELERLYEDAPIMKKIAECESGDRQFNKNGDPLPGQLSKDIGRFQINYVHWKEARRMGIDLKTEAGNAKFARMLYERSGTQPWYMSEHCWGN